MTEHRPSAVLEMPKGQLLWCLICSKPWPCPDAKETPDGRPPMPTDYDGQGKGHDPLCPYGPYRAPTVAPCRTCLVINKVRADEREQAAQRVAELHRDDASSWDRCVRHCIAAARGEA